MSHLTIKHILPGHMIIALLLIVSSVFVFSKHQGIASASINDASGVTVGVTYYGGEYDASRGGWIIENENQCNRIRNGEFTAASLGGVLGNDCNDDNGLGWINDIPLHNTVSYAELSNNPGVLDGAALGGLPNGAHLEIKYKNRCLVAEKRDNGDGGSAVNGYKRALDLWWQTAKAIGFTNGWDTMSVRSVPSSTPLSPLGGTSACGTSSNEVNPITNTIPKAATPASPTKPVVTAPDTNAVGEKKTAETKAQQNIGVDQNTGILAQMTSDTNIDAAKLPPKGISYGFNHHNELTLKAVLVSLILPLTGGIILAQSITGKRLFRRLFSFAN